jgi:hypothetical protein
MNMHWLQYGTDRRRTCFAGVLALVLISGPIDGFSQSCRWAALVASQSIDWNGWMVLVDSFDSSDPNWSTAGSYDGAKARDNGNIVAGGSLTDSIGIATANIYGHVQVGIGGGVSIGRLGGVGERSWQASHPGQIEPGWLTQETFGTCSNVAFPFSFGWVPGPGAVAFTNCINGTNCAVYTNYYDHVLSNSDYYAASLEGSTIVMGAARLILPNGLNLIGADQITVIPGGSIAMFLGTNSVIGGNGIINQTGFARNVELLCTPGVTSLTVNFIGEYIGILVAPNAAVQLNGSGTITNEFAGALVANSLKLNGNFNFHFDGSLIPAPARLALPSWSNNHQFLFSVTGRPGSNYVIEASTNLNDWASLATNKAPFTFQDGSAVNFPRRYYRAVGTP